MNFLRGRIDEGKFIVGNTKLSIPNDKMKILREQGYIGKEMIFGIRPEDIHDETEFFEAFQGSKIEARIDVSELTGAETMLYTNIEGQDIIARINARSNISLGLIIELALDMKKGHFFNNNTEKRIV